MNAWIPTLKPGDVVGLTNAAVPCERHVACMGRVTSFTASGMVRVLEVSGRLQIPWIINQNGKDRGGFGKVLERWENVSELAEKCERERLQREQQLASHAAWRDAIGLDVATRMSFRELRVLLDQADGPTEAMRPHVQRILAVLEAAGLLNLVDGRIMELEVRVLRQTATDAEVAEYQRLREAAPVPKELMDVLERYAPPPPQKPASPFRPLSEAGLPTMGSWSDKDPFGGPTSTWRRCQVAGSGKNPTLALVTCLGWSVRFDDDTPIRGPEIGDAGKRCVDELLLLRGWHLQ